MNVELMVFGGLLLLVPVWVAWAFNRLVKARNQLREGWSGIEVQLKRGHDLVPALVACVQGYQTHERELLEAVTRDRSQAAGVTPDSGGSSHYRPSYYTGSSSSSGGGGGFSGGGGGGGTSGW